MALTEFATPMWRELYEQSDGLRGPFLSRLGLSSPIGFKEIASLLTGARAAPGSTKLNYFRGFVNGREDYRLAERLLEQDLDSRHIDCTLANLFAKHSEVFGKRPGMVINGGLQWSEAVQHALALESKKLTETVADFFTLDLTLFMGSYGSTPFGAHIDDASHRTVLFNLGPNEKRVKIWDRDEVERQFGQVRNIYDFEKIAVPADEYKLLLGDCFVLPSSQFHVAINDDVSITVALVINHPGQGALAEQELAFHSDELDRLGISHPLSRVDIDGLSALAKKRHQSNCHLRYPIQWQPSGIERLKRHSLLQRTVPFNLQLIKLEGAVLIYSRGRHYISFSPVTRVITILNQVRQISVADIIALAEQDGCEVKDALSVIDFLLSTSSISFR